jgi:hypothetical protein
MSPETFRVLCGLFALWGLAVAVKAATAVRGGTPYVFSFWDGGMIRAGKSLSPLGARVKVVIGVAIAIGCVLVTARVGLPATYYGLLAVLIASVVSDFALAAD